MNSRIYFSQTHACAVRVLHWLGELRTARTYGKVERNWRQRRTGGRSMAVVAVCALCLVGIEVLGEGVVFGVGNNSCCAVPMTPPADLGFGLGPAAGWRHALAILTNGTVRTWGVTVGPNVPSGLSNVVQVAGNFNASLALRSDGTVVGWGFDTTNVPPDVTNVVQIAADVNYATVLKRDGSTRSWGSGLPTNWPAVVTNVVEISTRGSNVALLRADGSVLSYGTTSPADLTNAVAVSAGLNYSMALRADGTVAAWGEGSYGQENVPAKVTNIVFIAAGYNTSAAINEKGKLFSWGWHYFTNLLNKVGTASSISLSDSYAVGLHGAGAPRFTTPFVDRVVSAGQPAYFRAHATGSLPMSYQWRLHGTNVPGATNTVLVIAEAHLEDTGLHSVVASNELGSAVSSDMRMEVAPLQIVSAPAWTNITVGSSGAIAVVPQGRGPFTYQWMFEGTNLPGATNDTLTLTNVQRSQTGFYTVTVSNEFGAATTTPVLVSVGVVAEYSGASVVWPDFRILRRTNTALPLHDVVAISASGGFMSAGHTLALTSQGKVLAWGTEPTATNIPAAATNIIAIAAGEGHSLALNHDGRIFAWGSARWGFPLGQEELTDSLSNVVAIAAGDNRVALMSDGVAVVWGISNSGAPKQQPFWFSNVVAISAYAVLHENGLVSAWDPFYPPNYVSNGTMVASCETRGIAVLADGSLRHWGTAYQLGPPLTNVAAIDCTRTHYLALQSDGTVVAWGDFLHPPRTNVIAIAAGEAYSAFLIGDGPPRMRADVIDPELSADGFSVKVPAESGRVYRLEYKKSMSDTDWKGLPLVAGRAGTITLLDPAPGATQRFYRVRRW